MPAAKPVTEILHACAGELADLAARCAVLQGAVGAPAGAVASMESLQALDLITQRAEGLSQFLARLAETAEPAWRLDPRPAAALLRLADLAAALTGAPVAPAASGDLDLFDTAP